MRHKAGRVWAVPAGVLVVGLGIPGAMAADLRVPSEFATVQDALNAASGCDRVLLAPGIHVGSWYIAGDVTVEGDGPAEDVIVDGDGAGAIFQLTNGATVRGVTLQNGGRGIEAFGSWVEVDRCLFTDLDIGVRAQDAFTFIHDSTFTDLRVSGVDANRSSIWLDRNVVSGSPVGLELVRSSGRVLEGIVEGAEWGIRVREGHFDLLDVLVQENATGVMLESTDSAVFGGQLLNNRLGLQVLDAETVLLDALLADNEIGILTTFGAAHARGLVVRDSLHYGLLDGIGSQSDVADSLFLNNRQAGLLQLADTRLHNVSVVGGELGFVATGGAPDLRSVAFVNVVGTAFDASQSPDATHGWNLFWSVGAAALGGQGDGGDVAQDPLLGADGVPGPGSPAIDAGDPNPELLDRDGSRNDVGRGGGPDGGSVWEPLVALAPEIFDQIDYVHPEGYRNPVFLGPHADGNSDPLRITWDTDPSDGLTFCDGIGGAVDFLPPDDGAFEAWVRVEDPSGLRAERRINVGGFNVDPTVSFTEEDDLQAEVTSNLFVDAWDPSELDVLTVDIDLDGDGVPEVEGAAPGFVAVTPAAQGTFLGKVVVYDDDGGWAESVQEIVVGPRPAFLPGEEEACACAAGAAGGPGASLTLGALGIGALRRRRR